MPTELIAIIAAAIITGLVVIGAVIALPRRTGAASSSAAVEASRALDKYASEGAEIPGSLAVSAGYGRAVRVVWWISIASLLVGVGLSGAYRENQPLIYAVGAVAVAAVLVLHELLPAHWRVPGRAWAEAAIALALVTALVVLTGRAESPLVIGYPVVTVGVALARGARAAAFFAAIATLAYIGTLDGLPPIAAGDGGDLLRIGATILGIWLVSALAGAYAAQERRARSAYVELSLTDPLTGLFNRSQIFTTLDQEVRRTRRSERGFCVLMIDLDGLKAVNDSFGHHRGDDLLRHLGTVIRRSIRTVDAAYRYGGDEFVVLLPETDIVGAFVVAEKIRTGTEELGITLGLDEVDASVSIGLVSHPEDGLTVEELMIAADRAMYQAKSLGKNQISGYPRPRRLPPSLLPPPEVPRTPAPESLVEPMSRPEAAPGAAPRAAPATVAGSQPRESTAAPSAHGAPDLPEAHEAPELRPVEMATDAGGSDGASDPATGEEEPDPADVRRQIATASRSFDPDHQIRRAMDAFLGPMPRDREH